MSGYLAALLRAALGPAVEIPAMHEIAEVEVNADPPGILDRLDPPLAQPVAIQADAVEQTIAMKPPPDSDGPTVDAVRLVDAAPAPVEPRPPQPLEQPTAVRSAPPLVVLARAVETASAVLLPPVVPVRAAPAALSSAPSVMAAPVVPLAVARETVIHAEALPVVAPAPPPAPIAGRPVAFGEALAAAAAPAEQPPPVMLTIGRVDIRITPPAMPAAAPRRRPPPPGPSLNDYLAGRGQ